MRFSYYVTTRVSETWTLRIVLARNGSAHLAKPERGELARREHKCRVADLPLEPLFAALSVNRANQHNA